MRAEKSGKREEGVRKKMKYMEEVITDLPFQTKTKYSRIIIHERKTVTDSSALYLSDLIFITLNKQKIIS